MLRVQIREACEAKGVTASQLADDLGITRATISRYWRGNRLHNPNLRTLERIAKYLGVPAISLIQEVEDKESKQ
jgi:transcriptional regulator with XRE-family HTH domain